MNERWSFYEFGSAVTDWLAQLDERSADFEDELWDILQRLALLDRHLWLRPDFSLVGDGLGEIRLKPPGANLQGRIYGCFGPHRRAFIMLIGSTKKGTRHYPKEAKKTAVRRRAMVKTDANLVRAFEAD